MERHFTRSVYASELSRIPGNRTRGLPAWTAWQSVQGMIPRVIACLLGLWLGLLVLPVLAQELPEWQSGAGVPPPPEFSVRDDTDFLGKESGAKRRIADRLHKLEADHGYRLYLVIEPVLIGTTAPELAEELRAGWLPKGDGMVVVFEANTSALGIGQDLAMGIDLDDPDAGIPNHEASAVISRAIRASGDPRAAPAAFIETLVMNIADGIDAYYKRRSEPTPAERSLRMNLLVVGSVALLTLGALLAMHFHRRAGNAGAAVFRFPESSRPERLGAPSGGGNVTSRSFAPGANPDSGTS